MNAFGIRLHILLVAAPAVVLAAGCISPDFDRTCGEGEPECFRYETCVCGECVDRDEAPAEPNCEAVADGDVESDTRETRGEVSDTPDSVDAPDSFDTRDGDTSDVCLFEGSNRGICRGKIEESAACPNVPGYVRAEEEANPQKYCNGLDDDCDGLVDEGCSCNPERDPPDCYHGPPEFAGVGQCKSGDLTCDDTDEVVVECLDGRQMPQEETCNGLDDDCDGETDEQLPNCN